MKRFLIIFTVSFLVFALIIGGSTYYYLGKFKHNESELAQIIEDNPDLQPPSAKDDSIVNFLVMGIDDARSDLMMVVRFNKDNNKAAIISIPRDTRVYIENYGYDKINHAVSKKEGALLAMDTVGKLLDIPIHYYFTMDFKGAEKIIDVMGGVKVNVPINMKYDDPTQNLHINIKKGEQVLNGKNAVHFVRYRATYANGDLDRIPVQQQFAKALIEHMTSPKMLPKAFSILDTASKYLKTNMDQSELASYALRLKDIDVENIKMYTLPGDAKYINNISYFIYDEDGLKQFNEEVCSAIGIQKSAGENIDSIDDQESDVVSRK
ncbi:LCP family protein [Lutispora thermophila]|uniref:Transcriptional attenuator, LytR family n=1 Tax=Lutispora thermophila DSM 19022 TaxID=1122184 RepID=A0A1M6DAB7_9FIRM|nr:LCP family protein [Lutispora thermophila]SHI70163.1 transcriptional attenuator, LytR family [Lutispora thermophila DSM 19022]